MKILIVGAGLAGCTCSRLLADNVVFCGRLVIYKYLDMDKVILQAMNLIKENII